MCDVVYIECGCRHPSLRKFSRKLCWICKSNNNFLLLLLSKHTDLLIHYLCVRCHSTTAAKYFNKINSIESNNAICQGINACCFSWCYPVSALLSSVINFLCGLACFIHCIKGQRIVHQPYDMNPSKIDYTQFQNQLKIYMCVQLRFNGWLFELACHMINRV